MNFKHLTVLTLAIFALTACADDTSTEDSPDDRLSVAFSDGKADSLFGECETERALAMLNDVNTDIGTLKDGGLHTRAARNIIEARNGADGIAGTEDDVVFQDLREVDDVYYVGPVAFQQIATMVAPLCVVQASQTEVIFSPQPYENSHLKRVAELIDEAEVSLDIAMYSFRDAGISQALERAVDRGVSVRMLFEKANAEKNDPEGSSSARIEDMGIDVRYVNKIMHHKFVLIDGPRNVATVQDATTDRGILSSGSGNWSNSAGTRYDENTVFVFGNAELNARFQREFNTLWNHSRDFSWNDELEYFETDPITEDLIADDPAVDAIFTSDNFRQYVSSRWGNTFSTVRGVNTVATRLVEMIEDAEESIYVASGHLRSRPIAEALIRKKEQNPDIDIKVYLDGQEYIAESTHRIQEGELEECLVEAGDSETQRDDCIQKGFYFSYPVYESGIDLKFKYYSFRWHYSYAEQMHHKYIIFDESIVASGSYNFSDNAENNTFENVIIFDAAGFPDLVDAFLDNFDTMWVTAEDENLYGALMEEVTEGTSSRIPIVFDSMALNWEEVNALKSALFANCADVNTYSFRRNPERHYTCTRR